MIRYASSLVLLLIFACESDAKYHDYGRVLESPEYKEMWSLLAPENMLATYTDLLAAHADGGAWLHPSCHRDMVIVSDAIARREKWALTMLDASSRSPPSGLFRGNLVDLGVPRECSTVSHETSGGVIRGLPCVYSFSASTTTFTLPENPTLSICLPAACSADDVFAFFNATTFSWTQKLTDLRINLASAACSPADTPVWDLEFVVCLTILAVFVAFLIACTVIEIKQKPADDECHSFVNTLAMFSLRRSIASILNMQVKEGTVPAIDGIRCLSMAWITFYHEFYSLPVAAIANRLDLIEWARSWKSLYVALLLFGVDTFLTVSGFLTTYLFLKQRLKKKEFNIPMYYLHPYIRLTPAVLALMVLTIVFVPKLGSGNRWDEKLSIFVTSCRNKWWPALVYLQNYVNKENYCLVHLWYLAVDMQLFWISPLILYPLHRKPKLGLILLAALLIFSVVIPASVVGMRRLPVVSLEYEFNATVDKEIFLDIYINTYTRAGPWLIGIFLGYEVAMHDHRLNKLTAAAGWLTTIASFAFCALGHVSFMDPEYEYDVVWETFYSAVRRPVWALGVCWIIYTCIQNQAGFLSQILSFRIYLPFSRLSYSLYLVHYVLQIIHNAALQTPTYFSEYYLWRSFITTLMISAVVAFVFSILFETPFAVMENIFKRKQKSQSQKDHTQESELS